MRFHFSSHNFLVYGRDGDDYLISDPIFEEPVRCPAAAHIKARFAKGALASKGMMYYLTEPPQEFDLAPVLSRAMRRNYRSMTGAQLPIVGIRGIR
ncbi:MAG: hypothetical protein ACI9JM_000623 [Halioglobus sp.]|jgi:hypothetical protein